VFTPGLALEKIKRRAEQIAHVVGTPVTTGGLIEGLERVTGGFRRAYSNGMFYMKGHDGTPFWLDGPTAHRYDLRGNTDSFLGFPVADLEVDPSDPTTGLTRFERGAIYFFPDLGIVDVQDVVVAYEGFHCFGETSESSAHDEPYFVFGVLPVNVEQKSVAMTVVHTAIDSGQSVLDRIELYRGPPLGISISVSLIDHDHGNPEHFKEQVDQAVDKAADKLVEGLAHVPVVGPALAVIAEIAFIVGGAELKREVTHLLGTEDDHIATEPVTLSTKELLRLAHAPVGMFEGIPAHLETPLLTDGDASYKTYFRVEAVAS
jgi:hypothetical protein